jgi:DNA-binding NarL/FixJ family response regulator
MNIIVVERDDLLRGRLDILFSSEALTNRVESYSSAEEAIKLSDWDNAQVLVTGIGLAEMDGVQLIDWTRRHNPQISCIVFSRFDDRQTVLSAIRAGASGYLLDSCSPREMIEALQGIYRGGAPMSPHIARMLLQELQQPAKSDNPLTRREQEILGCLDKDLSYKEVVAELGISPNTVHTHVKNINEKLQSDGREDAVLKARRLGWV